jgi:dihydrodipicolinate reductase
MQIKHQAHDRKLFAQGAIFAASKLRENTKLYGLHPFSTLVESQLTFLKGSI